MRSPPARWAMPLLAMLAWSGTALAQGLSGTVRSAEEGPMGGVLVNARAAGSTITVVTDAEGRFAFPAGRLPAGPTELSVRAAGWDLAGPEKVELTAAPVTAALILNPATEPAMQLSNAEWIASLPGGDADNHFLQNCTNCHTLKQPLFSDHDAKEFVEVQLRMASYAQASSLLRPQVLLQDRVANQSAAAQAARRKVFERQAAYLAQHNLRQKEGFDFRLTPFPRPSGRATRMVVTEYDLPETTRQPHDVIVTADGMVWYNSFTEQVLGRLDPKTGETREWMVPTLKPNSPKGSLALRADRDGNLWMGLSYQGGVARFDPRTETFRMYPLPARLNRDSTQTTEVEPRHSHVDGKVWIEDSGTYSIYRMDVASGEFVEYLQPRPTNIRRVFVTGGKPATFWAGSNHGASIVRLEPLD